MADKPHTTAPFPTPPPFYQHFTKQNLTKLREIRKEQDISTKSSSNDQDAANPTTPKDVDPSTLPQELRYLLPPALPAPDASWRTFGATHSQHETDPTLASAGIESLFPNDSTDLNPQPYLLSLARSLLTTFLSLTGVLSQDPTLYEEKIEDLKTIVLNMHDLINRYRPHQARESLILMLEERVERLRGETRAIAEARERVQGLMGGLGGEGALKAGEGEKDGQEGEAKASEEQRKGREETRRKQADAWAAMDALGSDDET